MKSLDSESLLKSWGKLSGYPGGKWLFSRVVGQWVPYTGTIKAVVDEVKPGSATVSLKDRRKVRNHLHSVHAMALANLGEFVTGLALHSAMPSTARAILVGFSIQYLKKARGTLQATSEVVGTRGNENREETVSGTIYDGAGEAVAKVQAVWRVGPKNAPRK